MCGEKGDQTNGKNIIERRKLYREVYLRTHKKGSLFENSPFSSFTCLSLCF